jgi:hypothetical protein
MNRAALTKSVKGAKSAKGAFLLEKAGGGRG